MPDSQLKTFYESLLTEVDFRRLIQEKAKEDIHLEFKEKKDRSNATLDESDRRQFSRALSGFANSDGGVLLWGIKTDKQDRAQRLKPITGISEFVGVLKKSILNSTQPVVDGVLIDMIPSGGDPTVGYVKCLIPPSDKAPHRAMLEDREYFKRTTEGFYRLEHFDLEDMFGRRPHPSLTLHLELRSRPGDDPHEELHFGFVNVGRGIAKYVGFVCRFESGVQIAGARGGPWDATAANNGMPTVTYAENSAVIHPTGIVNFVGHAIVRRSEKSQPLRVQISWYCENMTMRSFDGLVESEKGT